MLRLMTRVDVSVSTIWRELNGRLGSTYRIPNPVSREIRDPWQRMRWYSCTPPNGGILGVDRMTLVNIESARFRLARGKRSSGSHGRKGDGIFNLVLAVSPTEGVVAYVLYRSKKTAQLFYHLFI